MTDPNAAATGGTLTEPDPVLAAENHQTNPRVEKPRSILGDAWIDLRKRPMFIVSLLLILFILSMVLFPSLYTSVDPNIGDLNKARQPPQGSAWFGYDVQGRDVFARTIYGARASVLVGVFSTILTVVIGMVMGVLAGFFGGWIDGFLSRIADVFFGLPFLLGAIVILTTFNPPGTDAGEVRILIQVIVSIAVLSWPVAMRLMRSMTLSAKQQDYVKAARSLGASTPRIVFKHLLPNAIAPVLVYSTIALGANIGAEATLSLLGVGLRSPVISWGVMTSDAATYVQTAPHMMLFPAAFVALTVLAFVMLNDVVRDALDPKSR